MAHVDDAAVEDDVARADDDAAEVDEDIDRQGRAEADVDGDDVDPDDLDEEDIDGEDVEGDDVDEESDGGTHVARLTSIGEWEMFRVVTRASGRHVATVGLAPAEGSSPLAYAIWFPEDDDEPGRSGAFERPGGRAGRAAPWDDAAREAALRALIALERPALEIDPAGATFALGSRERPPPNTAGTRGTTGG